jgi:hypothetical protein
MSNPIVRVRPVASVKAAGLGLYPSRRAVSAILRRVAWLTPVVLGLPPNAMDAEASDTPAS